jgi:uncharacterized membrane protein
MPESSHNKKSPVSFLLSDKSNFLAFLICLTVFLSWMKLLIYKFINFGYYDWDLAIYANAMWALSHGSFNGSLWGTNFLTNHAEYISILIAPIYRLFPSALTLITLKLLSVIAGGFVFYLIARERVHWILAIVLMVMYFAFPANFFMLIFEFHFESLAIVFLFLVYYYLRIRISFAKFFLCCILASLCKENIPPVIFMFGFMSLFQKNTERKFAWAAMSIGAGIFISEMVVITPLLRHLEGMTNIANPYVGIYWPEQEKLTFAQNFLTNGKQLCSRILSAWNATYVKDLFFPLLFIPLLGLKTLLIALPLFLQAILANIKSMHTIFFHYAATLTPFLFLATLEVITWIYRKLNKTAAFVIVSLIFISLLFNMKWHSDHFFERISQWEDGADLTRQSLMEQIPSDAGVIGTFEFLSHLADRDHVYPLRNVWVNKNPFKPQATFVLPETPYALIDWNCPWIWGEAVTKDRAETITRLNRIKDFYFNNHWQVKAAGGDITLLEKTPGQTSQPLVEIQRVPFVVAENPPHETVSIDNTFELLNSTIDKNTAVTLYWKADSEITEEYIADFSIYHNKQLIRTARHHLGYAIYATPIWQNGDYIKETYWVDTSALPVGEYSIKIVVGNLTREEQAKMIYRTQPLQHIPLGTFTIRPLQGDVTHEK